MYVTYIMAGIAILGVLSTLVAVLLFYEACLMHPLRSSAFDPVIKPTGIILWIQCAGFAIAAAIMLLLSLPYLLTLL